MKIYHLIKFITFNVALFLCMKIYGQSHIVYKSDIKTLQVTAGDEWQEMPVIHLGSSEQIKISFDELSHDYHRYTYKITHCDAHWNTDELLTSDYLEGFSQDNVIDSVENSLNTNVLYTHYNFSLPNSNCKLKMSGNYKVHIIDDESHDTVVTACFIVAEEKMKVALSATSNTDKGVNTHWQQVDMQLSYSTSGINNPQQQIQTYLVQNNNIPQAVINAKPQYIAYGQLTWSHCNDYIFDGGNVYHKFETIDLKAITPGLDKITWDGDYYHAWLIPNEPVRNYSYDESARGSFLIRNSDYNDVTTTCDYVWVHFKLITPHISQPVYIMAQWTQNRCLPEYEMFWNEDDHCYERSVLLKQGYYSYRYVCLQTNGSVSNLPTEGQFFQTSNKYTAIIYYRPSGARTDLVVGTAEITFP